MSENKPIRIKRKNSDDASAPALSEPVRIKRKSPPTTPPPELESDEEYDTHPLKPEYYPSDTESESSVDNKGESEDEESPFISEEELKRTDASIELVLKVGNSSLRLGIGSLDNEQTRQIVATLLNPTVRVVHDEGSASRLLTTILKVICIAFMIYLVGQIGH